MKTYLVTGAAGFIGANYIKYILAKHNDIKVVILDALTYAGNLGTIANDIDDERCFFVKGDICDRVLADELFAKYKFDYVVNFAAESHVDRSIENPQLFLMTNILGTQNLLDAARRAEHVTRHRLCGGNMQFVCAPPAVPGSRVRTSPVIPLGAKAFVTIKCLPTKFTAHLVPKATSQSKPRSARTALTAPARRVPIW